MEGNLGQVLENCLQCRVLTLATRGPRDLPMSAALFFAYTPDLRLFFLSSPKSQHSLNLERDPRASVCFFPSSSDDWRQIRGVQMVGNGRIATGKEAAEGWAVYLRRFGFVVTLASEVKKTRLYCFTPEWVRLIDNRRGLGHKEEWFLE